MQLKLTCNQYPTIPHFSAIAKRTQSDKNYFSSYLVTGGVYLGKGKIP